MSEPSCSLGAVNPPLGCKYRQWSADELARLRTYNDNAREAYNAKVAELVAAEAGLARLRADNEALRKSLRFAISCHDAQVEDKMTIAGELVKARDLLADDHRR